MRDGPTHALERRLSRLRRRVDRAARFRELAEGFALLVAVALALGLLDRYHFLPGWARALGLAGLLVVLGRMAGRLLVGGAARGGDDLGLARRIEARFPVFREQLVTAVHLLRRADQRRAGSSSLRQALLSQTLRQVRTVPIDQMVDRAGFRRALGAALAATVALGLVVITDHATVPTAMVRLAAPFGDFPWTRIADRSGTVAVLGEPFDVRAEITGVVPATAEIIYREDAKTPSGTTSERTLPVKVHQPPAGGSAHVAVRLPVRGAFRYRIRAFDAESPERGVAVATPPALLGPTVRVELIPPRYSGLPSTWQTGRGDVSVIRGTRIVLRATVDRPIHRAWVEFELADSPGAATTSRPRSEVVIAPDAVEVSVTLDTTTLPSSCTGYTLRIEDADRLASAYPFALRLQDDPRPVVVRTEPAGGGEPLVRLPTAVLDMRLMAGDPRFGLRSIGLVVTRKESARSPESTVAEDGASGLAALGGRIATIPGCPLPPLPGMAPVPVRVVWRDIEHRWNLARTMAVLAVPITPSSLAGVPPPELPTAAPMWAASIRLPLGAFHDGQTAVIRPLVLDNRPDVAGLGWGDALEIRIVDRPGLDRLILDERFRLDEEVRGVVSDLRRMLDLAEEADRALRADRPPVSEALVRLHEAEQRAGQIARRLGPNAMFPAMDRLHALIDDNGVFRPDLQRRLESLHTEMRRLQSAYLDPARQGIHAARTAAAIDRPSVEIRANLAPAIRGLAESMASLEQLVAATRNEAAAEARSVHLDGIHESQVRLVERTRTWDQRNRGGPIGEVASPERDELDRLVATQRGLALQWQALQLAETGLSIGAADTGSVSRWLHAAAAALSAGQSGETLKHQREAVRHLERAILAGRQRDWHRQQLVYLQAEHLERDLARLRQDLRELDLRQLRIAPLLSPTQSIRVVAGAYRRRLEQLAESFAGLGHGNASMALHRAAQAFAPILDTAGHRQAAAAALRAAEAEIEAALGMLRFDLAQVRNAMTRDQASVLRDRVRTLGDRQARLIARTGNDARQPRDGRAESLLAELICEEQDELRDETANFQNAVREQLFVWVALGRAAGAMRDSVTALQAGGDPPPWIRAVPHQRIAELALRQLNDVLETLVTEADDGVVPRPAGGGGLSADRLPGPPDPGQRNVFGQPAKEPWGHLPATIRQDLEQYAQDRFLPKYQEHLAEYYRALAERRRPPGE